MPLAKVPAGGREAADVAREGEGLALFTGGEGRLGVVGGWPLVAHRRLFAVLG